MSSSISIVDRHLRHSLARSVTQTYSLLFEHSHRGFHVHHALLKHKRSYRNRESGVERKRRTLDEMELRHAIDKRIHELDYKENRTKKESEERRWLARQRSKDAFRTHPFTATLALITTLAVSFGPPLLLLRWLGWWPIGRDEKSQQHKVVVRME